ncbi:MAG: phosphodiester glycosidase family protein, partial [Victivallaceae bacterium]
MYKFYFFIGLIFTLIFGNAAGNTNEFTFLGSMDPTLNSDQLTRRKIERLNDGIYFYQFQYEKLYGVKMSISLLMIDWPQNRATLGIDFSDGERLPVSTMAKRSHALAATNGTYFLVRESLPYFPLKINGTTYNPPGKNNTRGCGAIAFNFGSAPYIGANVDSLDAKYANIIQGDHIVSNGKSNQPMNEGKGKAPHTAWGVTAAGWTIMLVVDGRTAGSGGMNYGELADFMVKIGCVEAVSIDGGGSRAFYLGSQQQTGFNGIV